MEKRKCINKNCQKTLPLGYKYKYCEHCRNEQSHGLKKVLATFVITTLSIITLGKIRPKK